MSGKEFRISAQQASIKETSRNIAIGFLSFLHEVTYFHLELNGVGRNTSWIIDFTWWTQSRFIASPQNRIQIRFPHHLYDLAQ